MRLWGLALLAALSACSSTPEKEPSEIGPKALSSFNAELSLQAVWQRQVGQGLGNAHAELQPAIVADRVYAADAYGVIQAIDLENGTLVWSQDLGVELTAAVTVSEQLVIVASANGELIALDRADGAPRWRAPLNSEVLATPVLAGESLAVQTIDGKIHLFNLQGESQWSYDSNLPSLTLRGTSRPVFHNDLVIGGFANGKVVALNVNDGSIAWHERIGIPAGRSELERLVDIDGRLLVRDDVLFVSGYQGHLAAIDLRNGKMMWKRAASSYHGPLYGLGNLYLIDADDSLVAFDERSGTDVWLMDDLQGRQLSEAVFFKGHIALADYAGYLHLVTQLDGAVVAREQLIRPALDWVRTGSYGLKHPSRHFSKDAGIRTHLVVQDDYLLAINNSGFLNLFKVAQ
ncbi:MAG: outer membrane protein assembly factor BamB [Bermanella sp.]